MENLELMSIIVPSAITIAGFIANFFLSKSTIKNEIEKMKSSIIIEKNQETIELLFNFLNKPEKHKNLEKIMAQVLCYGSNEAVCLFCEAFDDEHSSQPYLLLLLSQIKYDISGIVINPRKFLDIKTPDFTSSEHIYAYKKQVNQIVDDLKLNKGFKIM